MASSESNITKDIYTMDVGRKNGSFQSAILWILIYWFQTFPYTSAIWKRPQDNFVKIICCLKTNKKNWRFFKVWFYEILQPPEEEELIKKIEETARKWEPEEHTSTSTNWDFNHVLFLDKDRKSPGLMVPDGASCRTGRSSMFLRCSTRSTSAKRRWGHNAILSCCHLYPR